MDGDAFHLQPDSPCIDAGTSEGAPAADLEGAFANRVNLTGREILEGNTYTGQNNREPKLFSR